MAFGASRAFPSPNLVQTALISAQICFGLGSIISALGLPACNPFAFALYREICAGMILLGASHWCSDSSNTSSASILKDWRRFTLLGLALFGNQASVIAGIKLAGPVAASVWQPSQPIITAAISILLGWEPPSARRIFGVVLAFMGCAGMVFMSAKNERKSDDEGEGKGDVQAAERVIKDVVGNALFFFNCLCTSLYVLLSKKPLLVHPPMKVTSWSYNIAAAFMLTLAYLSSLSNSAMEFLCPDCTGTWNIPAGAVYALLYAIVFNSVVAYFLITWANQYATGTLVIGYSVLQPVTAAILATILIGIGLFPSCRSVAEEGAVACLNPPGWGAVMGMFGVFAGLALVILSEPTKPGYETREFELKYEEVGKEEGGEK